jgi:hypothetical protein
VLVLEVDNGPEEGRILRLDTPGQHLGRWDPEAPGDSATLLYRDLPWDPSMSRRHAQYRGWRAVELLRPAVLLRDGRATELSGDRELRPGDRLRLGGTWLRVL